MYPVQQAFLVLGLSRSGTAVAKFLLAKGATVYIYDDLTNERVGQVSVELEKEGAKPILKEDLEKTPDFCNALVLSPGIPIDHPLAIAFKKRGRAVLGEMEIAARYARFPVIGITGTNGKTTTVSMLTEVLQKSGFAAVSCGNIGTPMTEVIERKDIEVAVTEISSFQLETLNSFTPHIAMVLNISEDHLNRHYTMENYVFLKRKILKNLTETEYAILNYDDPIVRGFAERVKAKVLFFSLAEKVKGGYFENGDLYFGKEKIMSCEDLPVGGMHNVQNALAVIIAAKIMGISTQKIVAALSDFKGVKHRMEQVGRIDGVTYIDDSKGTNVDATLKAVSGVKEDTILLLGGKNKGYHYGKLFSGLKDSKVLHAVLYGENRYELLKSAMESDFKSVSVCENFEFAVRIAALKAKTGQTVLLSPASASFDEFSGYEERGEKFVEIIQSFEKESVEAESENFNELSKTQSADDGLAAEECFDEEDGVE